MKANVPEKIYLFENPITETPDYRWLSKRSDENDIEYIRTDAFIEKAAQFLYDYNQKQVLKHGARATLGCGEYTINVDEFRKYMKGRVRMTLKELRDKIDAIIEETPSWADVNRIGIVTNTDENGFKDMEWLVDFRSICCDGQGMVAFELVMED